MADLICSWTDRLQVVMKTTPSFVIGFCPLPGGRPCWPSTAARMIDNEPLLDAVFDPPELLNIAARSGTYALAVLGVLSRQQQTG